MHLRIAFAESTQINQLAKWIYDAKALETIIECWHQEKSVDYRYSISMEREQLL